MLNKKPTICICGGGSLGHVIAGMAASNGFEVNILTRRAEAWSKQLLIHDLERKAYQSNLS